ATDNRSWPTRFRGRVLIHAAKGMTHDEYQDARDYAAKCGVTIPHPSELLRGGIVGAATVTGCVDDSQSPWFYGKYGFVMANAKDRKSTRLNSSHVNHVYRIF